MSNKSLKITYWTLLLIVSLLLLLDAFGGLTHQADGVNVLKHLGYPEYLLMLSGIAKLFAVISILQNKYIAIKEWAYSGLIISLILAFGSRYYAGDGISDMIQPIVFLIVVLIPYFLWRKIYLK